MSPEAGEQMQETLYSGYITQGPKVKEFEDQLSIFLGSDSLKVVTVNSATSALQLAVRLAKGKVYDHGLVISTPMTCTATNTAIVAAGAQILWADVNPVTGNIDPESVQRLLMKYSGQVRAIVGVDWGGHPCEWQKLNDLGNIHNALTIQDAAHAFGSVDHKFPDKCATLVCYSFQAIKPLTTVDGGAIVTRSHHYSEAAKLLRWFGIDRESSQKDFRCSMEIPEPGYKYHMNDVNASVGLANLPHINNLLKKVHHNAQVLRLSVKNAGYGSAARIYPVGTDKEYAPWIFTIRVEHREHFIEYMKEKGIMTGQVHARNDTMTCFRYPYTVGQDGHLSGLAVFASTQVNIPCGWWVNEQEINFIGECIKEYCGLVGELV